MWTIWWKVTPHIYIWTTWQLGIRQNVGIVILCKQFRLQIWQSLDLSSYCLYSIYKSTKWDSNIFVYDIRNYRSTFCLRIYFYHVHILFWITVNKKKLILYIDIKGFFYFVCLWIIIGFVWTFLNAGERRQLMR